jgi:hypothetical protein
MIRPFSCKQYTKWLEDNYRGWGAPLEGVQKHRIPEEPADVVESILALPDLDARRALAYLTASGISNIKDQLAADLYEIRD